MKPTSTLCLLLTLATALLSAAGAPTPPAWSYFVSPSGSDENDGSLAKPFQTLAHAQQMVRAVRANQTGDIVVTLRGGTYPLAATLAFTPADSGGNGHDIVYRGYPGEKPVISGGKTVTGWTLHDAGKNIWQAQVGVTDNFRQIYVNGSKAIRARSKDGMGLKPTADGYQTRDKAFESFRDIDGLEVVTKRRPWTEGRFPITSFKDGELVGEIASQNLGTNVDKIKVRADSEVADDPTDAPGDNPTDKTVDDPKDKTRSRPYHPLWLENAYEFLDKPGYWYLDRKTHTLYYIPRAGEDMKKSVVEVPVLEQLIRLDGKAAAPVGNLRFEGLGFRLSNWMAPSQGLPNNQANLGGPQINAALDCTGARKVQVSRCTFSQLGGDGVTFRTASQSDKVDRCEFHDICATAIECGDCSPATEALSAGSGDIVGGITVSNCTIHDIGTEYPAACAVLLGFVQACTIEHNEIYHVPYSGISLGSHSKVEFPFVRDSRILCNRIHDHMRQLSDGGGIYTLAFQKGGLIAGNYIYDQRHPFGEIYLDDSSANWTVRGNVCKAGGGALWLLCKGSHNVMDGNFVNKSNAYEKSPTSKTKNTTVVKEGAWPSEADAIMKSAGVVPEK